MSRCLWTDMCSFFSDEVGYSTELQGQMRATYCLGDNSTCARLAAIDDLPLNRIPKDLLPTDHERLAKLIEEFERGICERCHDKYSDCER